jgi:hypothetical protein
MNKISVRGHTYPGICIGIKTEEETVVAVNKDEDVLSKDDPVFDIIRYQLYLPFFCLEYIIVDERT